ncbi:squamosa promoter-binding-like protein 9 [Rutidosis leptorrhynchoides]|uniref:squamosa promoter-binding-like protein 9 n=1 Tax=Rutidosis leptorrhynchoides TaxID=125765 RepID=UPI003A996A2C
MEMGGSSSSEPHLLKIGLKFGQKIYFEDAGGVGDETKSVNGLSPVTGGGGGGPVKKGRTSGGSGGVQGGLQPPRCQVEGCNLDLSDAKTYYSRHKVCGAHSKTPKVIVNGLEQRFCQQCSRFHQLPEFDQGKRSCRRRLAGHNERRRKPTSGTLLSARYGTIPSSIFESNGNSGGFLMDFSSCGSRGRVHWPANPRVATVTENLPPLPWQSNLDNPPPYINPNHVPPGGGGCFNGGGGVQDSNCALSLLSNHSSASRPQHEYYVNPDAQHMVQPPTGTVVHGHGQGHGQNSTVAPNAWSYDPNEAHLGLGQIQQSSYVEHGLGQQGARRYYTPADNTEWPL